MAANGYSFLGWYEKPEVNASRAYSISPETTGDQYLFGIWTKNVYTITYLPDSTGFILPEVEDGTYTIDKETSLKAPPNLSNMVWVGWSDENGKIVKSIPKGSTDNITLTANWMSRRSQTVPNTDYANSDPAIAIDEEKGIYAFTYEIGDIQNVPIQQLEEGEDGGKGFNLVKGQTHEISLTYKQKVVESEAVNVANVIANATTKSDSWTLSEDWNKSTTFSQEHSSEVSEEQSAKAAIAFSETGKYVLSSGEGGSEEHIDETGTSTKTTKKHELGVSVNVGFKLGIGAGAEVEPYKNVTLKGNISGERTENWGLDYKYTTETEKATHETHTDKTSSYWNTNESFENSKTLSQEHEFSQSISQSIKDTYSYGETLDYGGSNSKTNSSSNTSSESREYSSSIDYSTEEGTEKTIREVLTADADTGWYRKVIAANFKVFGVVIYDMKTNSLSTMSYSLKINGSEHLFTDYSTVSSFNDYENGVLPFEVPAYVGEYVYGLIGGSEGLKYNDETGVVTSYGYKDPTTGICYKKHDELTGTYSEPCDTDVIIPRYRVLDIGAGEKKIVRVTGISPTVFCGTNVTSVYLSDGITEIPESAFENCTSLKYVRGGTINTIGKNAFKNCTSLFEFVLPSSITSLGEGAFEKTKALTVNASNASVVTNALAAGAESLTINLKYLEGSLDNNKIVIPAGIKYFCLSGGGKTCNNVSVESAEATVVDTVVLNNITISNYADIPLKLNSNNIELGFTTINANGIVMKIDADSAIITLDGNNYLTTTGERAMLSKNIHFVQKADSSATGQVHINGDALVYGTATGVQNVLFDSDEHGFVYLTKEEYENMLSSHYYYFDANGGTVDVSSKLVYLDQPIGALPTPTREGFIFEGWIDKDGMTVSPSMNSNSLEDQTLRARWRTADWVSASEVPVGATVENERWIYTLTERTTSTATSIDGWTQDSWEWQQTGSGTHIYTGYPSGFDTNHYVYSWYNKSALGAYENDTTKREVSGPSYRTHVYYHWCRGTDALNLNNDRSISTNWTSTYTTFDAFESGADGSYSYYDSQDGQYVYTFHNRDCCGDSYWYFRFDVYEQNYVDYQKLFSYSKQTQQESYTEVSESDSISNVQHQVQYVIQ